MDRAELAERLCEATRLQVVTGMADAERLYHWSFRLLDAEREERDRVGAYQHHLGRMRRLTDDLAARRAADLCPEHEVEAAGAFVAEAEYWLALAEEAEETSDRAEELVARVRSVEGAARARLKAGQDGADAEVACLWSVRLLQGERDADAARELEHYRSHLDRVLELERAARRQAEEGPARAADVVEFFRWEAEYWLSLITSDSRRRTRRAAFALKRLHAAQAVYEALRGGFEPGRGIAERLYLWSLRWLRAMRDQDEEESAASEAEGAAEDRPLTREERQFQPLEEHLERMQALEAGLRASHVIGVALDLGSVEYFVLEARAWLRQARLEADLKGA